MVKRTKQLPKSGKKLGVVKYGQSKVHLYNIGGKLHTYAYSKAQNKYIGSTRHVGSGYMLRKLGIESNAGGGMFVPIEYRKKTGRKTFKGMTKEQIKKAQKKY